MIWSYIYTGIKPHLNRPDLLKQWRRNSVIQVRSKTLHVHVSGQISLSSNFQLQQKGGRYIYEYVGLRGDARKRGS